MTNTIRLRPGTHYAPIDGGVYFATARASFVVRGPAALFRVVDTCIPRLEDGSDVEQLVAAVGVAAARPLIERLLETFEARGLLLHLDRLRVPEPPAAERARFPETLSYLEAHAQDPYAQFRRVRSARVLVSGPAETIGPTVRGLVRAGFGEVVAHTSEPERLAALATRHPQVSLLLAHGEAVLPVLGRPPHVAVVVAEDTSPAEVSGRLPASCLVVPVRLGKDLAIVGPALAPSDRNPGALATVERLWARAAQWSQADGGELLVRPSGDLLAGALAGHLALDAVVGLDRGRVQLVHGPDLSSDAITVDLAPPVDDEVPKPRQPDLPVASAAALDSGWLDTVAAPWTGLFRITVPGALPQLPLALTLAEGRTRGSHGRVVGFGPDQEASTSEAALEALRGHCDAEHRGAGPAGSGPVAAVSGTSEGSGAAAVAAAGLDEGRAVLDGVLRLLAAGNGARIPGERGAEVAWLAIDDVQGRRLWRALEEYEATPVRLVVSASPEIGWHLVSVLHRRGGCRLGWAWGPTVALAGRAALAAAMAVVQVRRHVDAGFSAADRGAGYVAHLHDPYRDELAGAVTGWLAASGRQLLGRRLARDPVAGPIAPWCGTVWLEDRHADG